MHCEPIMETQNLPYRAWIDFNNWWKSIISQEKYARVTQMLGTPISTTSVTKKIFDQLSKFIEAQDRYVEFKFTSSDYTDDYALYLEAIKDDSFWRQRCVEGIRTDICSVVVIDLPAIQTSKRPEPYKYFVSPSMFVDIEIDRYTLGVEYFIFKQDKFKWDESNVTSSYPASKFSLIGFSDGDDCEKVIGIDDETYRVFARKSGSEKNDWVVIHESFHGLGYCPCIDFWSTSLIGTNGINKIGPISMVLKKLDYLLFYRALKDYMDLYGPFPILVQYDMEDDSYEEKTRDGIDNNSPVNQTQYNANSQANQTYNPATSKRKLIGPGSSIDVPQPGSSQDHNFMDEPMKFISMDVKSLERVSETVKCLEQEIITICTGVDSEYLNEIAKNSEMMNASFGEKETIFDWIKKNIERVHRFTTKTQAELRYGKEYFLGCTVDYGSDYFLKDSTTLVKEYAASVEAGMPLGYSNEIISSATNTRYKNNPNTLAKMRVLQDIEPYFGVSFETLKQFEVDEKDKINFIIKLNFNSFVRKFELENGSIVQFGQLIPYSEKIKIIQKTIAEYARNLEWTDADASADSATSGSESGE